jgi:hypothetical protein
MTELNASRSRNRPLERFADTCIATVTATATVTAATVLSVAALPAAVLASWRRVLSPRRRTSAAAD